MNRIPKTRYPLNLEKSYEKGLLSLVQQLSEIVLKEFDANVSDEINSLKNASEAFKTDSISSAVQNMLNRVKALSLGIFSSKNKKEVVSKHLAAIDNTNKSQFRSQMKANGFSPADTEPWISNYMQTTVAENISYISNVADDLVSKTEQIILRGAKTGQSSKDVKQQLKDQIGMSENKAKFIARDQTGTVFGQLTAERHKNAGIPGFMWSDSGDSRVRPTHHDRNGKFYSYDDPNVLLPGVEYNCRCVAIPEFDKEKIENGIKEQKIEEQQQKAAKKSAFEEITKTAHAAPEPIQNLISEHVTADSFEVDTQNQISHAYRPSTNKILINPTVPMFSKMNQQEIITHEAGHLIDFAQFKSWENTSFKIAVQIERKVPDWREIAALFEVDRWAKDDFFSDICSALTNDKVRGYAGHKKAYWERKYAAEREIFANLFAMIALNKTESLKMVKRQFPMIYGAFIKMIGVDPLD